MLIILIPVSFYGGDVNGEFASVKTRGEENPRVEFRTSFGEIELELFEDRAPVTVNNFLTYVNEGFYDGLIFHRVIDDFMIQGGGFYPGMVKKDSTHPPIINEAGEAKLDNKKGTIAMARTSDPDSATSQFFINLVDNQYLDWDESPDGHGYCVFGKVIKGMDIVEKIGDVKTHSVKGYGDVPAEDIFIDIKEEGGGDKGPGLEMTSVFTVVLGTVFVWRRRKGRE